MYNVYSFQSYLRMHHVLVKEKFCLFHWMGGSCVSFFLFASVLYTYISISMYNVHVYMYEVIACIHAHTHMNNLCNYNVRCKLIDLLVGVFVG